MNCTKILLERIKIFCCEKLGWNSAAQPYVPSTIWDTHDTIWKKHKLWGTWHGSFDCRKLGVLHLQLNWENCFLFSHSNGSEAMRSPAQRRTSEAARHSVAEPRSWITEPKSSGLPGSLQQRQETKATRFAFPQLITIILHSVLEPPCYSQFHLFSLAATISKSPMGNTMALSLVVDCQSSMEEHNWWGGGAPGIPTPH